MQGCCVIIVMIVLGSWGVVRLMMRLAPLVDEEPDCPYDCPDCLDVLDRGGECRAETLRRGYYER